MDKRVDVNIDISMNIKHYYNEVLVKVLVLSTARVYNSLLKPCRWF